MKLIEGECDLRVLNCCICIHRTRLNRVCVLQTSRTRILICRYIYIRVVLYVLIILLLILFLHYLLLLASWRETYALCARNLNYSKWIDKNEGVDPKRGSERYALANSVRSTIWKFRSKWFLATKIKTENRWMQYPKRGENTYNRLLQIT